MGRILLMGIVLQIHLIISQQILIRSMKLLKQTMVVMVPMLVVLLVLLAIIALGFLELIGVLIFSRSGFLMQVVLELIMTLQKEYIMRLIRILTLSTSAWVVRLTVICLRRQLNMLIYLML